MGLDAANDEIIIINNSWTSGAVYLYESLPTKSKASESFA